MRKLLLSIALLFASMSLMAETPQYIPIPISPNPTPTPTQPNPNPNPIPGGRPLSIVEPDIEASYFAGAITFVFNEDLGDCNIEVLNIATGDMWSASHSGAGATVLYTSEQSGTYLIFVDSDRGTYGGEFVL
ncbi:MAG: hypothetical protein IKC57_05930 [Alistipes sp.]|nr:hypothetical protein [Alistipes sp.]